MSNFDFDFSNFEPEDINKKYRISLYKSKMNNARAREVVDKVKLGDKFKLRLEMKSFSSGNQTSYLWVDLIEITKDGFIGKIYNKPDFVRIHGYRQGETIEFLPQNIIDEIGYRDHEPQIPEGY